MSKIVRVSPELKEFLAAPESQDVEGSAFGAHGVWAPGVILMRNLQFTSKALIICAMFLIPLATIAWFYNTSVMGAIEFSAKERLGVEYNREIFPVIDLAQQLRRDATTAAASGKEPDSMAGVKEKLQAAQAKLAEVDKRLGAELSTAKSYAAVQAAFAQTSSGKDMESVFKAHTAYVEALISLLTTVTDSSNLTLDPDLDSYFVMDAALFRVPDILENSGKLRGLGLAILKAGAITPEQQRALDEMIPIAEFQFRNMRDGLAKSFNANPGLAPKLNATQTLEDTNAFFGLARKNVIDAQNFSPEMQQVYLAAANKAIDGQFQLTQRLLNELDNLLQIRISTTKATLYSINAITLIGVILAAYLFYTFFLVTRGGLRLISSHLQEMAEGDLRRAPAKPWGRDEPAVVIGDLRKAYDSLHALIRTVRH